MSKINSFRELIVWQKAMDFVVLVYEYSNLFPIEERYGLTSQIRKSAVGVPSNMAEGYGRRSSGDYVRFLNISLGSLNECLTQTEIALRIKYLAENDFQNIFERGEEISKMLISLINKIEQTKR